MNLINKYEGVGSIWNTPDGIYAKKYNNGLYKIVDYVLISVIKEEIDSFRIFDGKLVYKLVNSRSKLFSLEENNITEIVSDDDKVFNISSGVLIESNLPVIYYKKNDFMPSGMYLVGSNLKLEKVAISNVYSVQVGQYYFNKSNKEVFSYKEDHVVKFRIDISNYGRIIKKHRDTGEVLSDTPNEIDGELFSYKGLLYVPLKGGQLLALNAIDGKKAWIWEHDRLGAYGIVGDKIYKQDGKEIFEINALNGNLIRSKRFSEECALEGFHTSGPIWVYQDIIVVADVLSGKICMLDRTSLKVLEFFTINQKLPFSNNSIVWHNNQLHILDLENTLHIFEKET
ncbi:PQQ-binding-like beta-propeller repeat protein [Labilibacter marinus]|uniref:hypothetical protein n=1 Tax=Labilibacter marinus TaxID=1477105 RepID=UPI00082FEC5E|nr:hypothetical protein [Labilibacter marinus]